MCDLLLCCAAVLPFCRASLQYAGPASLPNLLSYVSYELKALRSARAGFYTESRQSTRAQLKVICSGRHLKPTATLVRMLLLLPRKRNRARLARISHVAAHQTREVLSAFYLPNNAVPRTNCLLLPCSIWQQEVANLVRKFFHLIPSQDRTRRPGPRPRPRTRPHQPRQRSFHPFVFAWRHGRSLMRMIARC